MDLNEIRSYVAKQIKYLSSTDPRARAMLSALRRGVGKLPGEDPGTWNMFLDGLPESLRGRGMEASFGESAVYTALTLYAVHQQGNDASMHESGFEHGIGRAAHALAASKGEDAGGPVQRRMAEAARSGDIKTLAWRLRSLVRLLSSEHIPLDYGSLAVDLFLFQFDKSRPGVCLKWGRDFTHVDHKSDESDDKTKGRE